MENYSKYLTITPTETKWGLYVTTVGHTKVNPKEIYPNAAGHPESHAFTWNRGRILDGYYLVFISKGRGIFESSETKPAPVEEGTCFFLFPGIWHRYKPDPISGWEEYWVGFNGSYSKELMSKGFFSSAHPFVQVGLNEELLTLFLKMLNIVSLSINGYPQIISGIVLQMLGLINAISTFADPGKDETGLLIKKAKFIMRESIESPMEINEIARRLPMGYSKFRKSFKCVTGMSPNQYYLDIRLNKSKELLLSTNLKIDQIAYQTGFDDVFYFSRMFKKKNGVSPRDYRLHQANA